jgi:hypothetical protein
MGFGLDDWIYWHLIRITRDYMQDRAMAILHNSQFTVSHVLGFSVFTGPNLATDLLQSHCHFKSHMKSSWHSLIPLLPSFCSCQFRSFDSTTLNYCSNLPRLARTLRKTPSSVKSACLLVRYLAVDVVLLSRARVLRECVYRAVA